MKSFNDIFFPTFYRPSHSVRQCLLSSTSTMTFHSAATTISILMTVFQVAWIKRFPFRFRPSLVLEQNLSVSRGISTGGQGVIAPPPRRLLTKKSRRHVNQTYVYQSQNAPKVAVLSSKIGKNSGEGAVQTPPLSAPSASRSSRSTRLARPEHLQRLGPRRLRLSPQPHLLHPPLSVTQVYYRPDIIPVTQPTVSKH